MYGTYFSYKNKNKEYLIERFITKEEAVKAKDKYVVSKDEQVKVRKISYWTIRRLSNKWNMVCNKERMIWMLKVNVVSFQ